MVGVFFFRQPAAGKILCYGETASSVTTGLRSYFPMNRLTLGTSASIRVGISSECTLSETLGLLFGQFSIINGICGQHAFDAEVLPVKMNDKRAVWHKQRARYEAKTQILRKIESVFVVRLLSCDAFLTV